MKSIEKFAKFVGFIHAFVKAIESVSPEKRAEQVGSMQDALKKNEMKFSDVSDTLLNSGLSRTGALEKYLNHGFDKNDTSLLEKVFTKLHEHSVKNKLDPMLFLNPKVRSLFTAEPDMLLLEHYTGGVDEGTGRQLMVVDGYHELAIRERGLVVFESKEIVPLDIVPEDLVRDNSGLHGKFDAASHAVGPLRNDFIPNEHQAPRHEKVIPEDDIEAVKTTYSTVDEAPENSSGVNISLGSAVVSGNITINVSGTQEVSNGDAAAVVTGMGGSVNKESRHDSAAVAPVVEAKPSSDQTPIEPSRHLSGDDYYIEDAKKRAEQLEKDALSRSEQLDKDGEKRYAELVGSGERIENDAAKRIEGRVSDADQKIKDALDNANVKAGNITKRADEEAKKLIADTKAEIEKNKNPENKSEDEQAKDKKSKEWGKTLGTTVLATVLMGAGFVGWHHFNEVHNDEIGAAPAAESYKNSALTQIIGGRDSGFNMADICIVDNVAKEIVKATDAVKGGVFDSYFTGSNEMSLQQYNVAFDNKVKPTLGSIITSCNEELGTDSFSQDEVNSISGSVHENGRESLNKKYGLSL